MALTVPGAAEDASQGLQLRRGEAGLRLPRAAGQGGRIEAAGGHRIDAAIRQPVQRIALLQHALGDELQFLRRQRRGEDRASLFVARRGAVQGPHVPGLGNDGTAQPEARIARHHPVEEGRKALCRHQRGPAAIRAAHVVAALGRSPLIVVDQAQRRLRHTADRGIGVVDPCLLVHAEGRIAAVHALVAGIRRDDRIAPVQCRRRRRARDRNGPDGIADDPVHAAAALEEEAAVPAFRHAELEADAIAPLAHALARRDQPLHQAMGRHGRLGPRGPGEGGPARVLGGKLPGRQGLRPGDPQAGAGQGREAGAVSGPGGQGCGRRQQRQAEDRQARRERAARHIAPHGVRPA